MKRNNWFDSANDTEYFIQKEIERKHPEWDTYKICWPDLLVIRPNGKFFLIEVKNGKQQISERQHESFKLLKELGIKIEIKRLKATFIDKKRYFDEIPDPGRWKVKKLIRKKLRKGWMDALTKN